MADITFAIGEVAAMLGVSPHTLRAWERRHLIVHPARTAAGQRRYTADDVELLRQIKHERHVHGLSMRVATLTAQGVVVPDQDDDGPGAPEPVPGPGEANPVCMVADLVSEVVVVIDARGHIVHANTAFVRFTDVLQGQLNGMAFADFADPFDRAKAVQLYRAPLRQRRDWELNLQTSRRRALFSFDSWLVPGAEGQMLVLVGRDLGVRPSAEPVAPGAAQPFERAGVAAQLHALLDGVADPIRTLGLVHGWLDHTQEGVVLVRTDADLTVEYASSAFARLAPEGLPPVEGRPLRELMPDTSAAQEVARAGRPLRVRGVTAPDALVWDVDLYPVTRVGGRVTHLVLVIVDLTAEASAAGRLEALVACAPALREPAEPHQLLRSAARHVRDLLPNAGSMVAAVTSGDMVSVVAASGVWSRVDQTSEQRLRLALVRDAVATGSSIEVERGSGRDAVETLRIVPLLAAETGFDDGEAVGALAFSRLGPSPFSLDDRQLIDEFAGRLSLALARTGRNPGLVE